MVNDKAWLRILELSKTLDDRAQNEDYVCIMTNALVMTVNQMYTDAANDELKQQDKADLWSLIDKLGNYNIKRETIKYIPAYQELKELIKEVF